MKRRNFLKKLFGATAGAVAVTAVPGLAKTKDKETFTIEDAFIQLPGNKNLYYIKKDSVLNQELMKALGDRYLPKEKFGCYLPIFNQYVPIKDTYTVDDFNQLIMMLEHRKFDYFCDGRYQDYNVGLMRLLKVTRHHLNTGDEEDLGYYKIDMFQAFKNGMYAPDDCHGKAIPDKD